MGKAFLYFTDGTHKVISPETGLSIWQALNGDVEPTEQQAEFLPHISNVFLPPSIAPDSYVEAHRGIRERMTAHKPVPSHLTNPGIEQGMYSAMPNGDR